MSSIRTDSAAELDDLHGFVDDDARRRVAAHDQAVGLAGEIESLEGVVCSGVMRLGRLPLRMRLRA